MMKFVLAAFLFTSLAIVALGLPESKLEKSKTEHVAANPLYCTMCQYAVQFIDVELKKNSTEEAIIHTLDVVCKVAPKSTQQECESLINTYGIYLVQLLIQFGDPQKVCQAIKLC